MNIRAKSHSNIITDNHKNDYLNDRLYAQRLLSIISFLIPFSLFVLYLVTPHATDSGSGIALISISATVIILAVLRLLWSWKIPRGDKYQLLCAALDFLAATAILIGYSLSYEVPISVALKSPTANIFFIYLASRIVLFNGIILAQTGAIAIGVWATLVGYSMLEPNFVGRTSSYIEYQTSFKVLLGAEVERLLQFGFISAILYAFVYFARHDSPKGFLRRTFFLQSILKFLSSTNTKSTNIRHALIEFRTTDMADINPVYNSLFKLIPSLDSFKTIKIKKLGRLSNQSCAVSIEYPSHKTDFLEIVETIYEELHRAAILSLGIKTPPFVIGGAHLDPLSNDPMQLSRADIAIREAIKEGKKALIFDENMQRKLRHKQSLEQAIKQGLEKDLFSVAYQPIIDLMTNRPVGFEALVRLRTETGAPISPAIFIPIAESSGLIDDITDFLCDEVASEALNLSDIFIGCDINPYININISPLQLKDINRIISALERAQKGGLTINAEITESSILNELIIGEQIETLKSSGFAIAIDDFGTGYSSIQRLNELKSMTLKIDQSFVRNIEDNEAFSFLEAIINLVQTTSNQVIVEGVETIQQKLLLMRMGVRYCQGYFYGKPMNIVDLEKHLKHEYGIARSEQRRVGHIAPF